MNTKHETRAERVVVSAYKIEARSIEHAEPSIALELGTLSLVSKTIAKVRRDEQEARRS